MERDITCMQQHCTVPCALRERWIGVRVCRRRGACCPIPLPPNPSLPVRAATVTAITEAKCLVCTRADFDRHLGSLEDIRNMWRFEALRKVRPA